MIYFTADTHFDHANIIRFCDRPFSSVEDMNETLIANWNARVGPDDEVWHLGDLTFAKGKNASRFLDRLNGRIHLIWGNHDSDAVRKSGRWRSSQPYAEIRIGDVRICLFHYAMRVWNGSHHGAFHFFGHTHNRLPEIGRSHDVGVDAWDFRPVTLEEIKARMTQSGEIRNYGV